MPLHLDTELLRTFVAIADAGGFTRAAQRVHRTQSAVSLQMKRLEAAAGTALFRRQGRAMVLTEAGERLLGYARRILVLNDEAAAVLADARLAGLVRFGAAQDFADDGLPLLLARFARANPQVVLEVRVDGNRRLAEAVTKGELDLALTVRKPGAADRGVVLARAPLVWIAGPEFGWDGVDPLPLVLFEAPCDFRQAALQALDAAAVPWRVVYTSTSLQAVRAAVRAGIGVTVRTGAAIEGDLRIVGARHGLPALPMVEVVLQSARDELERPVEGLIEAIREAFELLYPQLR